MHRLKIGLDELLENVKLTSTKGLTEDLINGYSILKGSKYFSSGVLQNYLVLISAYKYIEFFIGISESYFWKLKGMSEENIENPPGWDNNVAPNLINSYPLADAKFGGNGLINNIIYAFRKVRNLCIFYVLHTW